MNQQYEAAQQLLDKEQEKYQKLRSTMVEENKRL